MVNLLSDVFLFVCFLSEVFARSVTETEEPCETSVLVIYCCNIN